MFLKHRNSQKRIFFKEACYFVTLLTQSRVPFFKEELFCKLFVENLRRCKSLKGFYLYGGVILYDHVHLLIEPGNLYDLPKVMFSIKKQFSHDINRILGNNEFHFLPDSLKVPKRLGAYGREANKFITKYQNRLQIINTKFHKKHQNLTRFPKFRWQKSYHDHYMRNKKDFNHHLDYITHNPQRHRMPVGWKWVFEGKNYSNLID